jgi:hypothetical protein
MGLSSYGNRRAFDFSWLIDFENGELKLNTAYVNTVPPGAPPLHRDDMNFNAAFLEKDGRAPQTARLSLFQIFIKT